jgi:hypothetical protein
MFYFKIVVLVALYGGALAQDDPVARCEVKLNINLKQTKEGLNRIKSNPIILYRRRPATMLEFRIQPIAGTSIAARWVPMDKCTPCQWPARSIDLTLTCAKKHANLIWQRAWSPNVIQRGHHHPVRLQKNLQMNQLMSQLKSPPMSQLMSQQLLLHRVADHQLHLT